jgi:CRP-like cAMP-binding protein
LARACCVRTVAYETGEVVYRRGEVSHDLCFLLAGEVHVMSHLDGQIVTSSLSKEAETFFASDGKMLFKIAHPGAAPLCPPKLDERSDGMACEEM